MEEGGPANKKRKLKFERQQYRPQFDTVLRSKEIWNKLRERKVGWVMGFVRFAVASLPVGAVCVAEGAACWLHVSAPRTEISDCYSTT